MKWVVSVSILRPFGPRSTGDAPRRFGKDELLHFAYQIFDADDNGWISHEEFILLLSDLHPLRVGCDASALVCVPRRRHGSCTLLTAVSRL